MAKKPSPFSSTYIPWICEHPHMPNSRNSSQFSLKKITAHWKKISKSCWNPDFPYANYNKLILSWIEFMISDLKMFIASSGHWQFKSAYNVDSKHSVEYDSKGGSVSLVKLSCVLHLDFVLDISAVDLRPLISGGRTLGGVGTCKWDWTRAHWLTAHISLEPGLFSSYCSCTVFTSLI